MLIIQTQGPAARQRTTEPRILNNVVIYSRICLHQEEALQLQEAYTM
jgi:hypothetical protein